MIRSCIIFVTCLAIAVLVYSKFINEDNNAFVVFTAKVSGTLLNIFDSNGVHVDGTLVSSNAFSMRIVTLCTGLVPMIIFVSAVLAYPSKIKHKALGIIIGIVTIYLLNLARVVIIFYIGSFFPSFFNTAHGLIWQSIVILSAIVLWLLWAGRIAHGTTQ